MATYVIGDVHGQFQALMKLLDQLNYHESDELWFVGDLINRGPDSLPVLKWVTGLPEKNNHIVLGNHDISLLYQYYVKDMGSEVLRSLQQTDGGLRLIKKMCQYPLFYIDQQRKIILSHAGLHPLINLDWTERVQEKFTQLLCQSPKELLRDVFHNQPECINEINNERDEMVFLTNAMTRMRYLTGKGCLDFDCKLSPKDITSKALKPWYLWGQQIDYKVVFGHWASLGLYISKNVACIDAGAGWNDKLAAFDIDCWRIAGQVDIKNNKKLDSDK